MRFQNPLDLKVFPPDELNHLIGRPSTRASRLGIEIQYGVNNGAARARLLENHIGHGACRRLKKCFYGGVHNALRQALRNSKYYIEQYYICKYNINDLDKGVVSS
jgi:hypothetical protein